jgi:hypothetical protein
VQVIEAIRTKGMKPFYTIIANVHIQAIQNQYDCLFSPESGLQYGCWSQANISRLVVMIFLCQFCLSPSNARATTIAVIKMDNIIGIAADSRATYKGARLPDACKIHKCDAHLYVVEAGNVQIGRIDFRSIALKACRETNASAEERANRFEQEAINALRGKPVDLKATVDVGMDFVGDDGRSTFFLMRAVKLVYGQIKHWSDNCKVGCPPQGLQYEYSLGAFQTVMKSLLGDPSIFADGASKAAMRLVTAELTADRTGNIGFPISVLEIGPSSARWIQYGVCQKEEEN